MTREMPFDRQSLEQVLSELGRRTYPEGKTSDIAINGGSALILTYDWRVTTRDVDAVLEPMDALRDACIAAGAEHLARSYRLKVPDRAESQALDLARPYFAGGLESLRARLTVESPTAFRRRMLFVSKNALSRSRAV